VGDAQARQADFRLVCATHRDLAAMVEAGEFRRDLYYRINSFPIALPALRERREDVPLLCEVALEGSGKSLDDDAAAALSQYDFPGNVRELRNILERAVLLADGPRIGLAHLPEHVRHGAAADVRASAGPIFEERVVPLSEIERRYLRWAAAHFQGDRSSLARALGLSERTLYRKLRELDTHQD